MPKNLIPVVLSLAAVLLGLLASSFLFQPEPTDFKSGTRLNPPRQIAPFALTDANSQPFTPAQFSGRWSLVFAGFTHCPDVCPTTLTLLKQVTQQLEAEGKPLQVVFLSIDPGRDRPEALKTYVEYFNPGFIGVTAQEPALMNFARGLGMVYAKVEGKSPGEYTMDHSTAMVLVNPQGQIEAYITAPHQAATIVSDLSRIIPSRS